MGSRWTPSGPNEVGIDGYIELFDPVSGEALGKNLAVQSKAVSRFAGDKGGKFHFDCKRRDIDYWLQGNMPVLLIVSRPESEEAYWISVKDYFRREDDPSQARIHFDKEANRLSKESFNALLDLGRSKGEGLYLAPQPRPERLYSNLLSLGEYPARLWAAQTDLRYAGQVWTALRKSGGEVHGNWFLRSKTIFSFADLGEYSWSDICDPGTVEEFGSDEWAESDDPVKLREFVELLNLTLRSQLFPQVRYWPKQDCFAMAGNLKAGTRKLRYESLKRKSKIAVVTRYEREVADGRHFEWLRHLAFRGRFRRLEQQWFLEITPTYRFTSDGISLDRFHESRLKGIKRFEGNRAVLSAVLFWASYLREVAELFESPPLVFGQVDTFDSEVGLDDSLWAAQDEPAPLADLTADEQLSLLSANEVDKQ